VFSTTRSRVPLKEILNTNLFDFEKAATGAGWLQSLKEDNMITHVAADGSTRRIPKPETLECVSGPRIWVKESSLTSDRLPRRYGISSFVYRERRPFHPERLWELMCKPFAVIQTSFEEDEEDVESGDDDSESGESDDDEPERTAAQTLVEEKAALDLPARAQFKREHPVWKTLLRSKGESSASIAPADKKLTLLSSCRLLLAGDPERDLWRVEPGWREARSCFASPSSPR
jgi:hypothetical protein